MKRSLKGSGFLVDRVLQQDGEDGPAAPRFTQEDDGRRGSTPRAMV